MGTRSMPSWIDYSKRRRITGCIRFGVQTARKTQAIRLSVTRWNVLGLSSLIVGTRGSQKSVQVERLVRLEDVNVSIYRLSSVQRRKMLREQSETDGKRAEREGGG